ncbi:MAG TPA: hypothetical protein VFF94_09460, partial [Novosphingobium sp.]|nr:hypothetical protein [Novosphingobium sp.]
ALQGLYYWDQHRIKYRYFTDVTAQWGVPVGLGEITAEQASRRTFSIALAYQGGEVVGAKAVNGAGLPMAVDDPSGLFAKGTAQIWLTRTDHRVTAVELLSATGKRDHTEIYAWQPDGSALVSLVRSGGGLSGGALGEPAVPTANTMPYFPSTIAQYRLSFNAGGQLTQRLFRNAIGAQAAQEDGSVGYAYAYDGRGYLVLRRTILSAAGGEASLDRAAQLRFHVNAAGLGEETDWLDAAGHPVPGDNGYARLVRQFDRAGNVVAERYTDGAGRPAIDKASGAASVRLELDGHGLRVVQRYFGTGAEPVRNAISGAFVERYRFDGQGRIAAAFWHDRQDRPMITATGAAGQSYAYDARGNRTDAVFLDAAGQPVAGVAGYVREHAEYDDKGNLVELAYQDGQGRPAANARLGYARTRFAYDERGNAVAIRRFGQDGQPVADANGNALYAMVYDDRNYLAEVHFLGPDGKPFAGPEGVAGIITHFDDQGRLTGVSYVDEQGNAALNSSTGTSFVETEYDERGRPIAYRYYDKDQRPVLSTQSGSAAVEISYNDAAHSRTETFLGLRDEPVAGKSPHCASLTIETDPRGNDVLRRCGDGRGGPMRDELGAAMVRWAYDSHDRMISAFYLDEAGHLARIAAGYAGVLIDLDDAGHPIRRRFVDIDGRAAVNRVTGTAGFDESYDALGHMVSRQFVGLQGQRAVDRPEGYWALRQKYDARGNAVEIRGLDTDGQPARLQAVGAFVVRFGYDAYNWQNEVRYLDLAGHLMLSMNGQGPAHIIQQRNAWRQETGWLNLDAADRPFMPAAGQERFARATFTYDPSGHQTAATYFDAAGHRIPAPRAGQ